MKSSSWLVVLCATLVVQFLFDAQAVRDQSCEESVFGEDGDAKIDTKLKGSLSYHQCNCVLTNLE